MKRFKCKTCDQWHESLPDIGSAEPYYYYTVPESERKSRIYLTSDLCIIDDKDFFIRGVLLLPLTDADGHFGFGAWISQSKQNFETYRENFDGYDFGPFFGWLSTKIDYYGESTLGLKTMATFQPNNQRPLISIEPTEHPLALDATNGITTEKAWDIAHYYMK